MSHRRLPRAQGTVIRCDGDGVIDPGTDALEEALDALLTRVRWYVVRGYTVPPRTAAAFNRIADVLGKPDGGCWSRIA